MTECADSGAARFRESVAIVLCSGNAGSPLVSYLRSVHLGYYGREMLSSCGAHPTAYHCGP